MTRQEQIEHLNSDWQKNNRWNGLIRPYTAEEVVKLRGSMKIEYTIAKKGSEKFGQKGLEKFAKKVRKNITKKAHKNLQKNCSSIGPF